MHDKKVLVVDDDLTLLRLVEYTFAEEAQQVLTASNGADGLRQFYANQPDLVILDVAMPEMDGYETCRRIRQLADVPIIMLTARGQNEDIIRGLEAGADDYVTKPFSPEVLVARAKAVLRRAALPPVDEKPVSYRDARITVDLFDRRVIVDGSPVKLTATEYRLLAYMVENAGRVLTFRQMLENVWGWEYQDDTDQARLYIWRLRQKIEADPKNPRYILTEYGVGYRFEKQQGAS